MTRYLLAALAGSTLTAAAVVATGAAQSTTFFLGFGLALAFTGAAARALGAQRLARFFAQFCTPVLRGDTAQEAARPEPPAKQVAFSIVEAEVIKALRAVGATGAEARKRTVAARAHAPQQFEPLFRAAAGRMAA
jgi:hypothetical protein